MYKGRKGWGALSVGVFSEGLFEHVIGDIGHWQNSSMYIIIVPYMYIKKKLNTFSTP